MSLTSGSGDNRTLEGAVLRAALIVLAVVVVVALAWVLRGFVVLIVLAVVVGAGLYGPAEMLEKRGVPRILSVVTVLLAVLAVTVLTLLIVVPPLVTQAVLLAEQLPDRFETIRGQATSWINSIAGEGTAQQLLQSLGQFAPDLSGLAQVPIAVLSVLADVVFVVFIGVLMLIERDRARDYTVRFLKPERRAAFVELVRRMLVKLGGYVRAQLLIMLVTGVGTGIGMVLLGVPFPLPMSLLAFLTEAIPLVGPWIAGVPIVLLAFAESPLTGVLMAAWMIGIQQVESYLLVPAIQGKVMNLSPLVVLLAVLAGSSLYGIVGALLAVPLVAVAHVVTELVVLPQFRARFGRETTPRREGAKA